MTPVPALRYLQTPPFLLIPLVPHADAWDVSLWRHPRWYCTLLFLLFAAHARPEDSAELTFHSQVNEVRLTFFSTRENNRIVTDLQQSDFAVVDNERVIRNFRSFSKLAATEVELVVLVDSSDSVLSHFGQEITGVLDVISRSGWIPGDHVSVIAFGGMRASVLCKRDCGTSLSAQQLQAKSAGGATPLYDALVLGAQLMQAQRAIQARPVFILFSDGMDNISRNSGKEALQAIFESEAQVYVVDMNQSPEGEGTRVLSVFADATGGKLFPGHGSAKQALDAVLDDLHSGYLVTYRLPDSGPGYHWIRIYPTHNRALQFRCRRGYQTGDRAR
jgi:VWFA-related protein